MRIAISGAGGYVGRFIMRAANAAGHEVMPLARPEFTLGEYVDPALFNGCDAFVHCAFDHQPGKYRGGEGADPEGFRQRNLDGSVTAFEAAKQAGVSRAVFLSSRAVYGDYPPGTKFTEETEPRPDTIYGEVKLAVENALRAMAGDGFCPVSLRATGVYGVIDGLNKWAGLIEEIRTGRQIAPRCATEVHGDDLAAAVLLTLESPADQVSGEVFNVSDILMDRGELWALVTAETSWRAPKPDGGGCAKVNRMSCAKLRALGWQPGRMAKLSAEIDRLIEPTGSSKE